MKPGDNENCDSSAASAHAVWKAIERDKRVAWRAEGNQRYLYRPNECLIGRAYEGRLARLLEEEGARPAKGNRKDVQLLERLGMRRWELHSRRNEAPEVVDNFRDELARQGVERDLLSQAVALNHVLGGAQVWKFGPADLPLADGPEPVVVEPSRRQGTGGGVRISILDTGFVKSSVVKHPLLADDYNDDGDDLDKFYDEPNQKIGSVFGGHGTFIAGIIRQQAPEAELDPEVTLDNVGLVDDWELSLDLLLRTRCADIVNLSLAGPTKDGEPPPMLRLTLEQLRARSYAVFVAAAGNDYELSAEAGMPCLRMWPAAFGEMEGFEHVVGVAAVDRNGDPSGFSNRGPWVRACAYGVKERSTYVEGVMPVPPGAGPFPDATARWSGTSFATPRVAGIIAATMTAHEPPLSSRAALAEILQAAPDGPANFGKFVD